MRLHELTITAFGPFAGTVEVDFDELSAGGLFLLTGATGAGKTSVLDAVCFALYGQVPGDRAGAKHLRSDHAPPQLAPEVVLRFSIGERQLTFTRSPAWSRPKLRGTGETRVQAHVLVEELQGGTWVALTNRLDDAGLLVTDLLGMTATQFTQVALLPQGRFQAFLRASSVERHAVLQQLFRTDRFERVERWLVDRRTTTRRASEAAAVGVLETINRVREASGTDQVPAWVSDLDLAADSTVITDWITTIGADAAQQAQAREQASLRADEARTAAEDAAARARRTHEHQVRGLAARRDLDLLTQQRPALDAARTALAAHHRAVPLRPLVAAGAVAADAAGAAQRAWTRQRSGLAEALRTPPEQITGDLLDEVLPQARRAETLAVAFAPRAAARRAADARLAGSRTELQRVETTVAEIDQTLASLPGVISDAVAAVHEARAAAARLPVVTAAAERTADLLAAARRAELVGLELAAARTDVLAATEVAQAAKEHYLDVREARINGMAGELAGQLASGCSCPVCGSAQHPSPALVGSGGVGRAEEDDARRRSEDAAFELQARQVGLGALESELIALDARLVDVDRAGLADRLAAAQDESERLEPLVAALDVLVTREQECRTRLQQAEQLRSAALLERAALSAEIDQATMVVASVAAEWEDLLAVPGAHPAEAGSNDLDAVVGLRSTRRAALESARAGLASYERTAEQALLAAASTAAAAVEAGFDSVPDALAALLPDGDAEQLGERLRQAELGEHAALLTIADPDVAEALEADVPDLVHLLEALAAASASARTAASARDAAAGRLVRISALARSLAAQLDAWAPVRAEHRSVAGLASLVEGKSVDNPLRMRLAAYVLAERLRQVVAAANERLARMTDQRYALEHTDDRGYGEQRGGLSLRIRDDWNGVQRDPATLSGGETFVVSLALALGLADTVAHEAGGTDIDTLFIDEGFGSLDADTLEDVMDTLDSLRDGGRVVGLVSHVPELRSRISTQLEVSKGRNGSTVRAAILSG